MPPLPVVFTDIHTKTSPDAGTNEAPARELDAQAGRPGPVKRPLAGNSGATVQGTSRPSGAPAYRIETIRDYEALVRLGLRWDRLVEEAEVEHPFLTHDWVRTWWECFGEGKELHVLLVKQGTELKGIAPMMLSRERMYGLPVRRLGFVYHAHGFRCDFIVARGAEGVHRAVWGHIIRNKGQWDVLEFGQLPAESRTFKELTGLASGGGVFMDTWESTRSPYVQIGEWTSYLAVLPRKHRQNLRNRHKRLGELGPLQFEEIRSGKDVGKALEDGFRIEAAAWKGKAGTAVACQPKVRQFYTKLAERAAQRGWLRLHFLAVDRRRIAFRYFLCYKNRLYSLKSGYDPEYAAYSPSNLLLSMILRKASERGLVECDLLGFDEDWKLRWTKESRSHQWLFVLPKTARGRLIHAIKFQLVTRLKKWRELASPLQGLAAATEWTWGENPR